MVKSALPSAGEVRALAQELLSWADGLAAGLQQRPLTADLDGEEFVLALATSARGITSVRARIFPDAGFANPAWAIMLELFIREGNGDRVSLDQLTEEEDLPALTAYRCLNLLIDKGLVERKGSQAEQQDVQLSLSPVGRRKMMEVLLESAEYASHRCTDQDCGAQTLHAR